jgi:hypothetical protein
MLGREAHHSPPSSAEIKECVELYLHTTSTPSWRGAQLKEKHMENFYERKTSEPNDLLQFIMNVHKNN